MLILLRLFYFDRVIDQFYPEIPYPYLCPDLQDVLQNIIENYRIVKATGIVEDDDGNFDNSAFGAALSSMFPTLGAPTNNWMYLTP